jgi:hypothetical protein
MTRRGGNTWQSSNVVKRYWGNAVSGKHLPTHACRMREEKRERVRALLGRRLSQRRRLRASGKSKFGWRLLVCFLEISVDFVACSAKCMQQQAMSGSSLLCDF